MFRSIKKCIKRKTNKIMPFPLNTEQIKTKYLVNENLLCYITCKLVKNNKINNN